MTRNLDLDLGDLFECTHEAETPVVDGLGNVSHWLCRCGLEAGRARKKIKIPPKDKLKKARKK